MRRLLLVAVLVSVTGVRATEPSPERPSLTAALKAAVDSDRQGARARAELTNSASPRVDELIAALKEAPNRDLRDLETSHEDDDVRISAAWALRFSADKKAIGPLIAAMRDRNFSVARAAAVSLNRYKAAEMPLRKLMADGDPAMRWRGVMNVDYVVNQLSPVARGRLLDRVAELAAGDPVDFIRADAAWTLRHASGPKTAEALIKCLADESPRTRYQAGIGLRGKVAVELSKAGSPTRAKAVETLVWILENHRDRPYATSAAVEGLTGLVVKPLGTHPGRWRAFLKKVEGRR